MGTFVTLAEVLEARGSPLDEDELWCLLLATTDALLEISKKGSGNMCSVLSPGSVLLSANGSLAFKSCARNEDVASFTAPEVQQGHTASSRTAVEKMVVYSLGMTLYWCVDYHLPHNQPVQISAELEGLLLSMCEDMMLRRTDLLTVLETCELHHKASMLPPAERLIRQLVEDVYKISADHVSMADNGSQLTDRSQVVRDRLHRSSFSNSTWSLKKKMSGTFSGVSYSANATGIPSGGRQIERYGSWQQLNRSPGSPYMDGNRNANSRSLTQFDSSMSLNDKKVKDMGPEFIRVLDEPLVVLELPGSIVSKKGKSPTTQRELSVVMPNGQSIVVRCEVKSRGRDVFDMIVAHFNLVEHFYFSLAYIDDNEFFFVDNDTKISKVAPDSWKKVPTATFVLFFRVKFFINDISLLLHKQTRHQYYLQLRRDLLEDRLSCHEETALYLGGLALQTEYGDSMAEVYGRGYYRPDQYVSKSVLEKCALPYIQGELLRLHTNNAQMLTDESELEFLKVCQQLPEYGVLFYRVTREKKPSDGEIILGVCAKGVIVYEVKDGSRSTAQTFYWRDTATISSSKHKFVVECRGSKKKHTFITERSKIAKYLCNLCSAQHKFNNEMNSRQLSHSLVSEENIVQYAAVCRAQSSQLKSFSSSETPQDDSGQTTPQNESMTKLYDDVTAKIEARIKQQRLNEQSACSSSQRSSTVMLSPSCSQRSGSDAPCGSPAARETPTKLGTPSEREVICVSLKKDAKLGLGIVIVGEDTVGRYDLGIFVASIVPGGPADKDGRIRAGGRLISLNHISLEGVTFSEAAEVMQNSPEEVQLIISQPKVSLPLSTVPISPSSNNFRSPGLKKYISQTTPMTDGRSRDDSLDEIVSVMMTPKTSKKLHFPPEVRILSTQDSCSLSSSMNCVKPEEISMELRKISGNLGISISGGINTNLPNGGIYIKSLVPGGAAERDGRLHIGDRLLEIDGTNFQGFTYQQAVECLSKTGEVVSLVVERELVNLPRVSLIADTSSTVSNPSLSSSTSQLRLNNSSSVSTTLNTISDRPNEYSFVTDDNTKEVTLIKNENGLGFSFLMCELDPPTRDFGSLVRIKQLFPGQPAEQSGRIQEGDVLLAINGQSLKDLSYPKVLKLFKTSPPEVQLTLCRPPPAPASSEATVCFRTKQEVATETEGRTADKAVLIS
ncbi:tyrosine-protein phosphatase non-receptor type 13 isoform X1 [Oreochromis niloticus]|uniref:tyrosine-protein phosphatase non-receptor type 13 isoform X1 n=1 Tax=Oreochromis niloticus TaxID=8128 RepID=UPI000DF453B9|nr:FERM and PDZ domain-containing protein 2 isoform X1 [Oreochromis niloticus]XP_025765393.1 FERM and PDZ domain-containing protein 2 isoform X1 [Oreochromis niloticus]XP_025765394.1 FERM and PDZ domain-containing protein 2 isoform X1 [Oreochromis niloticus]